MCLVDAGPAYHYLAWCGVSKREARKTERHLELARGVADLLCDCQLEDGRFVYRGLFDGPEQQDCGLTVDVTAQFASWLANVSWCLPG